MPQVSTDQAAFGHLDLDYRDFVESRTDNFRVAESFDLHGNPAKINRRLGWSAKKSVQQIMVELVDYEIKRLAS